LKNGSDSEAKAEKDNWNGGLNEWYRFVMCYKKGKGHENNELKAAQTRGDHRNQLESRPVVATSDFMDCFDKGN
jgi:hypothetical protein